MTLELKGVLRGIREKEYFDKREYTSHSSRYNFKPTTVIAKWGAVVTVYDVVFYELKLKAGNHTWTF